MDNEPNGLDPEISTAKSSEINTIPSPEATLLRQTIDEMKAENEATSNGEEPSNEQKTAGVFIEDEQLPQNLLIERKKILQNLTELSQKGDSWSYDLWTEINAFTSNQSSIPLSEEDYKLITANPEFSKLGYNLFFKLLARKGLYTDLNQGGRTYRINQHVIKDCAALSKVLNLPKHFEPDNESLQTLQRIITITEGKNTPSGEGVYALAQLAKVLEFPEICVTQYNKAGLAESELRDDAVAHATRNLDASAIGAFINTFYPEQKKTLILNKIVKVMTRNPSKDDVQKLQEIISGTQANLEDIHQTIIDNIEQLLPNGYSLDLPKVSLLADTFKLPSEWSKSEKIRTAAVRYIGNKLKQDPMAVLDELDTFKEIFHFEEEWESNPEIQEAIKEGFRNFLTRRLNKRQSNNYGSFNDSLEINNFDDPRFKQALAEYNYSDQIEKMAIEIIEEDLHNILDYTTHSHDLSLNRIDHIFSLISSDLIKNKNLLLTPEFLNLVKIATGHTLEAYEYFQWHGDEATEIIKGIVLIGRLSTLSPEAGTIFNDFVLKLSNPFISDLDKLSSFISEFALLPQLAAKLDSSVAETTSKDLIKYMRFLGDEKMYQSFPSTMAKIQEQLPHQISTNTDVADYFLENLKLYYQQPWTEANLTKAVQHYSVAQKFIYEVGMYEAVWKDEPWVQEIFTQAKTVVEKHDQFNQSDSTDKDNYGYSNGNAGFSESDQYENHPWRFTVQQIKLSFAIEAVMNGKDDTSNLEGLGVNPDIKKVLEEINHKVEEEYSHFSNEVANSSLSEDDKKALLYPESSHVKMSPLIDNVRSFVARYLVQSIDGDITKLSNINEVSKDIDRVLKEGYRRYIKVNEVDVPLYDKLYEEFDSYRETGRYPLEVYLGRDGIYAWIGRRTQDIARRQKLGVEGRAKLKEAGEVLEIRPTYVVYPRYFRDNLNYETKRKFLEQEGISPEADPLFYDTGYTGTIPEQIMKVMDFEAEDIEKRIRLLSAPTIARRVKGIPENARSEIIEYIEHNAKLEQAAEGLTIDERTGRIRHIAQPTTPEEQFYYMMVKQAITRHYWLKEQLYHEPSGNVNIDSERYGIRIRQEYAGLLPQEFVSNPQEYLSKHGELLKGSKGEGEYPDEEIILFRLTDGTEIIAKRIELRKAKEARKEFSILIAAKKANLPTAEPVGFLSAKQVDDGSYLLMEKLEGISGRKIEKYLRESGKYSEDQLQNIMQTVVEKNREMAEIFREKLHIDKRWRIKDTMVQFNDETGEVEAVIPIDWERVQEYDSNNPKEIDEIQFP